MIFTLYRKLLPVVTQKFISALMTIIVLGLLLPCAVLPVFAALHYLLSESWLTLMFAVATTAAIYYTAQTTVYLAMKMGVKLFISSVTGSAEIAAKVSATLPAINLGSILDIGTLIVHGIDVFKSGKARISFTLHVFTRICVAAGYHTVAYTFLKERVQGFDGDQPEETKTFISRLGGLLFKEPSREAMHRLQYFNAQALAAKNITAMFKLLYQFIEWYRSYDPALDTLRAQYEDYMTETSQLLGVDVMKIPMSERPKWKMLHERGLLLRANLAMAKPSLGKTVPAAFLSSMTQFENTLHNMEAVMKSWEPRIKPVTILLRGPAGTGKTTLSAALMNHARKLSHPDLTLEESGCFTYDYGKNVNARMDGVTHLHTLIQMNDMLQQTDALETAKEVQLINNIADTPPFFPDVAFMHQKRMATTRPDFLFITTNKSLHANTPNLGIEDPFALIRRPDFDIEMPIRIALERQPVVSKGELGKLVLRHERGHKRDEVIPVAKLMLMMKKLFIERKKAIGNYFADAEEELEQLLNQMKEFEHENEVFDVVEKLTERESRRLDELERIHQESLHGTNHPAVENETELVKNIRRSTAKARAQSAYFEPDFDELQYMRMIRVNSELKRTGNSVPLLHTRKTVTAALSKMVTDKPSYPLRPINKPKPDESSSAPAEPTLTPEEKRAQLLKQIADYEAGVGTGGDELPALSDSESEPEADGYDLFGPDDESVTPHAKTGKRNRWDWRDAEYARRLQALGVDPREARLRMDNFNRLAHAHPNDFISPALAQRYGPILAEIEENVQHYHTPGWRQHYEYWNEELEFPRRRRDPPPDDSPVIPHCRGFEVDWEKLKAQEEEDVPVCCCRWTLLPRDTCFAVFMYFNFLIRNSGRLAALLQWFSGKKRNWNHQENVRPHNRILYAQDHFIRFTDYPDYAKHKTTGHVINISNQKYIIYLGQKYHFKRGLSDEWEYCTFGSPMLHFPEPTGPSATSDNQPEPEPEFEPFTNNFEWIHDLWIFLWFSVTSFVMNGTMIYLVSWLYHLSGYSTTWTRIWMVTYAIYLAVMQLIRAESLPMRERKKDFVMLGIVVATALIIIIVWWSHRREKVTKKQLFKKMCYGDYSERREAARQMSQLCNQVEFDNLKELAYFVGSLHKKMDWMSSKEIKAINKKLKEFDASSDVEAKGYPAEEMEVSAQKHWINNWQDSKDPEVIETIATVRKLQDARTQVRGEIYTARERIKAKKARVAAVHGETNKEEADSVEQLTKNLIALEEKEILIKSEIYTARERLKAKKKRVEAVHKTVEETVTPHIATDANAMSIIESISSNLMNIFVRKDGNDVDLAQAVGIGGRDVLINKHALLALQEPRITVVFKGSVTEYAFVGEELSKMLKSARIFDNDRVILTHDKFPQFHNIEKHFRDEFPTQTTFIPNKLICVFRNAQGRIIQRESNPTTGFLYSPEARSVEGTDIRLAGFYRVLIETYPSMSGCVFVECNPHSGKKIIGTLCGGLSAGESVVVPVVKGEFSSSVSPYISSEMFKKLTGLELNYDPEQAEYRDMLQNGEPPGWHFYGQAKEAVPYCSPNKIKPTPLQRVITPTTAPNHCGPFEVDGKIRFPETLFMTSGVGENHPVDSAILEEDLDIMVHRMPAPNKTRMPNSVLSDHDALNGVDGTMFHEVPLDTSPGYRLRKVCGQGKIPYFKTKEVNGRKVAYLSDRARREVDECIELLKKGPIPVVMMVKNKNERYSKEKVDRKSRGVSADDARNLFILRKYLGPFLESLRRYMPYGSSMVGINADSPLWDEMTTYLLSNADAADILNDVVKAMALDGVKWEFRYPYEVKCCFRKAAEKWFELHYEDDPSSEDATIRRNIIASYENYFMILLDIILVRVGGMTTGFGATAEENGFGNELMSRVCFRHLCPGLNYDDHVRSVFYGDDFLATVYNAPNFNQITFAAKAKELFGIEWLTDRKVAPVDEYINLMDATFISRRFIRIPDTRIVMGTLEKPDIYEMALWARYSDNTDAMIKFRQNCENSLQFMMAYGKDEYEVWRKIINRELLRNKMPAIDVTYFDRVRHYYSKM